MLLSSGSQLMEAYRVNHSTVVACIETQVLGFLSILNSVCRIVNLSRKK